MKRILVAVNPLNGRDAPFGRALALARSQNAELFLLRAVPVKQPFSFRAAALMADMTTAAERAGVRAQTIEEHGEPAEVIDRHANALGVDLIVMGAESRRWWHRHRSLIAERVIRRTTVPALVVASDVADGPGAFRNVLVAVDLSPASKDVLARALDLMGGEAEQLTVMHAVNGIEAADAVQSPGRWKVPEFRRLVGEDARRELEAVVSEVPAGVDTRLRVSTGSAARAILQHAADVHADLVVVGRSRGFKLLGSTALRILRRNDRALLVIPGTSQRAGRVEPQRAA